MANVIEILLTAKDLATATLKKVSEATSSLHVISAAAFVDLAEKGAKYAGQVLAAANAGSQFADQMSDLSAKVGVSTERLSTLAFAAEQTGSGMGAVEAGIRALIRTQANAAQGSLQAQQALARLGVSATDTAGRMRSADELLPQIADSLAKVSSATERAALSQEVFGRGGADLVPILSAGSAGLKAFQDRAAALGVVVDGKAADAANRFQDTLGQARAAALGVSVALGGSLLPALQPVIAGLADVIGRFAQFIVESGAAQAAGEFLAGALRIIAKVAIGAVSAFDIVADALGGFVALFVTSAGVIGELITAVFERQWGSIPGIVRRGTAQVGAVMDGMGEDVTKSLDRFTAFNAALDNGAKTQANYAAATAATTSEIGAQGLIYDDQREKLLTLQGVYLQLTADRIASEEEFTGHVLDAEATRLQAKLDALALDEEAYRIQLENKKISQEEFDQNIINLNAARDAAVQASAQVSIAAILDVTRQATDAFGKAILEYTKGNETLFGALKKGAEAGIKAVANNVIDGLMKQLIATALVEQGKAAIEAPGTFGLSLLKIGPILAALGVAKAAVGAMKLQRGGLVTGGTPGMDSVPALLEPGEIVLPRHVASFFSGGHGGRGPGFQLGGLVAAPAAGARLEGRIFNMEINSPEFLRAEEVGRAVAENIQRIEAA